MKLEQMIARAERNEKRTRIAMVVAWALWFLSPAAMMCVHRMGEASTDLIVFLVMLLFLSSGVCALLFTLLYIGKYRPALRRTLDERQFSILSELEKRVDELSKRLPPTE